LKVVITKNMDDGILIPPGNLGMGTKDFGFFTTKPYIPSVYFSVGAMPKADFDKAKNGSPLVAGHHSPLFKITPEPSIKGVEATVLSLLDRMSKK
jgi:hippurate hydrolase